MHRGIVGKVASLAFVVVCAGAACGSRSAGGGAERAKPSASPGSGPSYFKVLVTSAQGTAQVNFAPADALAKAGSRRVNRRAAEPDRSPFADWPQSLNKIAPSVRFQPLPTDLTTPVADSGAVPILVTNGSALVEAAAAECGMVGDNGNTIASDPILSADPFLQDIVAQEKNGQSIPGQEFIQQGVWSGEGPYIFAVPPLDCSQLLEYEETIVCMADKLAELADTVGPLTWHAERFTPLNPDLQASGVGTNQIQNQPDNSQPPLAWTIPPPDEASKFIVRDLAINVLAHVAAVDETQFGSNTCAQLIAAFAADPTSGENTAISDFGGPSCTQDADCSNGQVCAFKNTCGAVGSTVSPLYPPVPVPLNTTTLAQERQDFETQNLRAAGQLLHDIVRESVFSDLAGAAAIHGSPSCNPSGTSAAFDLTGEQPYNSLGHVARTLLGRWEMDPLVGGSGEPDPLCQGVAERDLLATLADPGTIARVKDLATTTHNQAIADILFEKSGIVLSTASAADPRATLLAILVGSNTTAAASQALSALIGTLSAEDIEHGRQHNLVTFQLLTNTDDSALDGNGKAQAVAQLGLQSSPIADGIAVVGGLPRALVRIDPVARTGAMMVASECPEPQGIAQIQMDETQQLAPPLFGNLFAGGLNPEQWSAFSRQDVFAIGQSIRSRLVKLRELADGSHGTSSFTSGGATSRAAAIAEIGAWAGTGRVIVSTDANGPASFQPESPISNFPTSLFLDFLDVAPSDLGVSSLTNIPTGSVFLVSGGAQMAECAAHLRTFGCDPATLAAATTYPSGQGTPLTPASGFNLRSQFGIAGGVARLVFPISSLPNVQQGNLTLPASDPIYVVAAQDPSQPAGVGAILGAIPFPATESVGENGATLINFGTYGFALSPMRRELLNDAFGLGKWVGGAPPNVGQESISQTPSFCVEGVPLDVFVPLQNDLTDSTDSYENSWAHYLSIAQSAAANADSIGQEILSEGFQKTQAVENSAEQELTTTGSPLNVDQLSVDSSGNIDAGAANGAVAAILNQPTFDVVFLGVDPTPNLEITDPSQMIPAQSSTDITNLKTALNCGAANPPPICTRLAGPSYPTLVDIALSASGAVTKANAPNTLTYTALKIAPAPPGGGSGGSGPACTPVANAALQMMGASRGGVAMPAFDSGQFATAVQGLDENKILAALSQTNMTVSDDMLQLGGANAGASLVIGHWSVTYQGETVMDSDIPPAWPACLNSPASCNFATNPTTQSLNDMFRWCPNLSGGLTNETAPLGACEPNSNGSANPNAELNSLRWRVESALWLAAAMSGDIPQGMFSAPMPAANLPSNSSSFRAPVNMFFGNGSFTTAPGAGTPGNGQQPVAGLSNNANAGENEALNPSGVQSTEPVSLDPSSRYFQWGPNGSQQLPYWLLEVYAPSRITSARPATSDGFSQYASGDVPLATSGPPYVHVFGSNPDGPSDFSNLNGFFQTALTGFSGVSSQIAPPAWAKIGSLFSGQQCTSPIGSGGFGTGPTLASGKNPNLGTGWVQGLVAAIKTQQSTSSDMRKDYSFGNGKTWHMWSTWYGWGGSSFREMTPEGEGPLSQPNWFDDIPDRFHWYVDNGGTTHDFSDFTWTEDGHALGIDQRNPSSITPNERLRFALNSGAPQGNCDAAWQLTQAIALSCILGVDVPSSVPPVSAQPLTLSSLADLAALNAWLNTQVSQGEQALQTAFVVNVPAVVVANAMNVPGVLSGAAGAVGKDMVQASNALLSVYSDWRNVESSARTISNAVAALNNAVTSAKDQANEAELQQAISKEQTLKNIADDVAEMASGAGGIAGGIVSLVKGDTGAGISGISSGAGSAAQGVIGMVYDQNTLSLIGQLQGDIMQSEQDQINSAITTLNETVNTAGTQMSNSFVQLRQDVNNITAGTAALTADKSEVSYYAGKAAGADVWKCGGSSQSPVECVSHVNTVLNRRYDGDLIRYQDALKQAKGAAYLARLAIEQRIGVRLDDICQPIGTLDAPSSWADDVCHLSGVNYQNLQMAISPNSGTPDQVAAANQSLAANYADSFIGDYVQKLTDFVNFYNVAYPEQDGNDVAVLSLRETLLGGGASCEGASTNLLVDSSQLFQLQDSVPDASVPGWTRDACASTDAYCLRVTRYSGADTSSGSPQLPNGIQLPAVPGAASWLLDRTPPGAPPLDDGGAATVDAGFANVGTNPVGPDDAVVQQVLIGAPGTYALSWWDRAVDPNTGLVTSAPLPAYRVGIYDSSLTPVGGYTGVPNPSTDPSAAGWSARHVIQFTVSTPDVFYVSFAASAVNTAGQPGSVAIADTQLELLSSTGQPSAYVDTNSSGQTTSFACPLTVPQFQAAFQHNCDPDGTCHYDLKTPITINTQSMTSNSASLAGKLATGNFNFRNIDVALNLVGTGVLDCTSTGSPDCFGSGFVQYTLTDDGSNVGVLGWDGQYRFFDFGTATIDHAKAVTAERYITTPISSTDQSLINQFQAVQFRGRPMDGTYALRIYDTPALNFAQIQDIQLIVNYHFWSKVQTSQTVNH